MVKSEEFAPLAVAEFEPEQVGRTACGSFRWTQLGNHRLKSQQSHSVGCQTVPLGEPHHLGFAWEPVDGHHATGLGTPQGGASCGLRPSPRSWLQSDPLDLSLDANVRNVRRWRRPWPMFIDSNSLNENSSGDVLRQNAFFSRCCNLTWWRVKKVYIVLGIRCHALSPCISDGRCQLSTDDVSGDFSFEAPISLS